MIRDQDISKPATIRQPQGPFGRLRLQCGMADIVEPHWPTPRWQPTGVLMEQAVSQKTLAFTKIKKYFSING